MGKKALPKLSGLKDLLESPSNGYMHPSMTHTGEIWAEGNNAEVEKLVKEAFHPESTYKAFVKDGGFNDHKTACDGKCPEVEKLDMAFGDTPIGKCCPEELKPASY